MKTRRLLAFDLGASNGRAVLGAFDGARLELTEVHRFDNVQVRRRGHDCWDIDMIWENILIGLEKCREAGVVIAGGRTKNVLTETMAGHDIGTLILSSAL